MAAATDSKSPPDIKFGPSRHDRVRSTRLQCHGNVEKQTIAGLATGERSEATAVAQFDRSTRRISRIARSA